MEKYGTDMYDKKYGSKDETLPRGVVTYFVDKYLTPSMNCLDLGSGAGRHSKYIAEKGIDVTAIDLSEVGVEKTKVVLNNFPNSRVLIGDIHSLPFDDNSFDSLVCNRVLDYNDDEELKVALSEIERVVKSGGFILITVRSVAQQPKSDEVLISENDKHARTYRVVDSSQAQHYFSEEEIRTLAAEHHFEIVGIREYKHLNSEDELKAEWQVVLKK